MNDCKTCANYRPVAPPHHAPDQWAIKTRELIAERLARIEGELWQQAVIAYRAEHFPADGVHHG